MSTVKINKDSEEKISQLPGFDLTLARKVVDARNNGIVFKSIDQLAIFLQLKPHIIHKLDGLVSFEYDNNFISSNPIKIKKRTHKARVLDFDGSSNISKPVQETNFNQKISKTEFKICPNCNFKNELDHKFCVSCGIKLHVNQSKVNSNVNICPNCNEENDFDNKFCVFCGTKLNVNINNFNNSDSSTINNKTISHKSRKLEF